MGANSNAWGNLEKFDLPGKKDAPGLIRFTLGLWVRIQYFLHTHKHPLLKGFYEKVQFSILVYYSTTGY